jgi:hypothetical protein
MQEVPGSSPGASTKFHSYFKHFRPLGALAGFSRILREGFAQIYRRASTRFS